MFVVSCVRLSYQFCFGINPESMDVVTPAKGLWGWRKTPSKKLYRWAATQKITGILLGRERDSNPSVQCVSESIAHHAACIHIAPACSETLINIRNRYKIDGNTLQHSLLWRLSGLQTHIMWHSYHTIDWCSYWLADVCWQTSRSTDTLINSLKTGIRQNSS
jgi:hypothetical protein